MGQTAKLANNLLLWAGVVAAHEALLRGSGDSWVLRELIGALTREELRRLCS